MDPASKPIIGKSNSLILRELESDDVDSFFEGMRFWEGEDLTWYTFYWKPGLTFDELLEIERNTSKGIGLQEGWVPATTFYGFLGKEIVGRLNVRHTLNEFLSRRGGHIGYSVAPAFRGRGYASEMLRQALPKCKALGIDDLLITCADDNEPSCKIIEKFGGRLENKVWDDVDNETIRRYWIKL